MTLMGYVEPEAKMKNEGLMYSCLMRSFMYGEGVLSRSATTGQSNATFTYKILRIIP